ncbi:MAG: CpsD/CapB family tyrosine-protein kinase [Leptolyngbya sp. SIO4C1]|nr:CpsD/CapB family tyrosine-protein kinase [Leptolyngbya sp. SIO4C1]
MSNVVAGQLPLKQAIFAKEPSLHVLPVGVIPPNPLAILESKQLAALLQECAKVYDYIIIDTPPVLGLADTLTLGRNTDGLLLVMQPGLVDIDSINATKTLITQSQQKVLGLVANGVKVTSKPDRYFYYNQEYVIRQNQEALMGLSTSENSAVRTTR